MDHQGILTSVILGFLLCLFSITSCDPVEYTIKSSEDLSCIRDEPCFTFEQFVANISQHLKNQTMLRLNSGTHGISSGLIKVEHIDMFSITSETTASIINCTRFVGFILTM